MAHNRWFVAIPRRIVVSLIFYLLTMMPAETTTIYIHCNNLFNTWPCWYIILQEALSAKGTRYLTLGNTKNWCDIYYDAPPLYIIYYDLKSNSSIIFLFIKICQNDQSCPWYVCIPHYTIPWLMYCLHDY